MRNSSQIESIGEVAGSAARPKLGVVTRGSLQAGLQMRLGGDHNIEDIRAGKFVVISGSRHDFFAMITDATLDVASPAILSNPPLGDRDSDGLLRGIARGTSIFATVALRPQLMRRKEEAAADYQPVKTVPEDFSAVFDADSDDVAQIFGSEGGAGAHFSIGSPLDMENVQVCLDLRRFAERSNGIFGKSGTGKSFLTRICLAGLLASRAAVTLVFDMHNEHAISARDETGGGQSIRGLKEHDSQRVAVFTLDAARAARFGAKIQSKVTIPYAQVTVDDVLLLAEELNLTQTAAETSFLLERRFGSEWLARLLNMSDPDAQKSFCESEGANHQSLSALYRKLARLAQECGEFLVPKLDPADDAVRQIIACLTSGKHVVLEFGHYRRPLQYMLVANIITRRIHEEWTRRMDAADFDPAKEPNPLMIVVEEAHKFLSPQLSRQTIFGTIAREMRKYNVTLLIVDQRPSGIDDEVLSQLGTRITCLLSDERDIQAVLTGVSGASELRSVLASLDSKQQALVLGHAVPMPVVVRTRDYDSDDFRKSMGSFRSAQRGIDTVEIGPSDW